MNLHHAHVFARYESLTDWLATEGRVDVVEAAARLGVAQETIRRDLRSLERSGKLQRVHGGAVPIEGHPIPTLTPMPTAADDDLAFSAELWRDLPRSGTVLLGAGRLTLALAHAINAAPPEESGLTIVTNSLDAALVLTRSPTLSVYNVGGTVSPLTRAQEGDWALNELARFSVDVSVIAPRGVSASRGLGEDTPAAAAVSELAVSAARRVVVLADGETLGTAAFVHFAGLDTVDLIAVRGHPGDECLQPFLERGVSLAILGPGSVSTSGSPLSAPG